ncbi:unnamed protein product [Lepidochelys olivacea]
MAFHSLRPFYSSTNSAVKIHPAQGMPPYGGMQQITGHYPVLAKELEEGAALVKFYHLVLARGSLVLHGQSTVPLDAQLVTYWVKRDCLFSKLRPGVNGAYGSISVALLRRQWQIQLPGHGHLTSNTMEGYGFPTSLPGG